MPSADEIEEAAYEQLAAHLENRIRSGEFPPGSALPSRSTLRKEYGWIVGKDEVSQSVIDKAFAILRFKRLTVTQPGVAVKVRDPLPPAS